MTDARSQRRPRRSAATEPVLDFHCHSDSNGELSFGCCCVQGYRPHMEDRFVAKLRVSNEPSVHSNTAYFAVFDGHGGHWVSSLCAGEDGDGLLEFLCSDAELTHLLEQQSPVCDYRSCIRRLFVEFDKNIKRRIDFSRNRSDSCGSTAVILLLHAKHLLLANCGDSRGVVYIAFGNYYNRVTVDHSVSQLLSNNANCGNGWPNLRSERSRLEGLRYEMDADRGLRKPNDRCGHGLMITRSFGDHDFKGDQLHSLVSAEPSLNHAAYYLRGCERVAVLGSDGLWDAFSVEQVCEFAIAQLRRRSSVSCVSRDIVESALAAGSRDNITVILLAFTANVSIGVDTDVRQFKSEAAALAAFIRADADVDKNNDKQQMSLATEQRLLHEAASKVSAISVKHLFTDKSAPSVSCFIYVNYQFWRRMAWRMLQLMRTQSHCSLQQLTDLIHYY